MVKDRFIVVKRWSSCKIYSLIDYFYHPCSMQRYAISWRYIEKKRGDGSLMYGTYSTHRTRIGACEECRVGNTEHRCIIAWKRLNDRRITEGNARFSITRMSLLFWLVGCWFRRLPTGTPGLSGTVRTFVPAGTLIHTFINRAFQLFFLVVLLKSCLNASITISPLVPLILWNKLPVLCFS